MCWDVWFSRDTSPSPGARCQTIAPWALRVYKCHRCKGRSPGNRWEIRLIIKKYFKVLRLCSSQFSCSVMWASLTQLWRLHFLVSVHAEGHLQCRRLYISCLTETPFQSPNLVGIQMTCLAKCRACRRIRRLCVLWSFDHTWSLLFTVCRDLTPQCALSPWRHRWELLHPIWRRHESQKLNISLLNSTHQTHTPQVQISRCQTPTTHTKHHK